jgi:hypothetical protein
MSSIFIFKSKTFILNNFFLFIYIFIIYIHIYLYYHNILTIKIKFNKKLHKLYFFFLESNGNVYFSALIGLLNSIKKLFPCVNFCHLDLRPPFCFSLRTIKKL